jgi:hypothetical protein
MNRELHPINVLCVIAQYEPVHYSMFHQVEQLFGARITTVALRVLRRRGWIHSEINYVWILTDEGRRKAAQAAGGE